MSQTVSQAKVRPELDRESGCKSICEAIESGPNYSLIGNNSAIALPRKVKELRDWHCESTEELVKGMKDIDDSW